MAARRMMLPDYGTVSILIVFSQHFQTIGAGFGIADNLKILNLPAFGLI